MIPFIRVGKRSTAAKAIARAIGKQRETEQQILVSLNSLTQRVDKIGAEEYNLGAYLDNSIEPITLADMTAEEVGDMAKEHRLRLCIGRENGKPIVKQITAKTELELADRAVFEMLKSGRAMEFLPEMCKQLYALKSEPEQEVKRTPLKDYIPQWRKDFKQGLEETTQGFLDAKQNVVLRFFEDACIEDLEPSDIQCFLDERAEIRKFATVKADWNFLKEVLDSAVSDGIISSNPAKDKRLRNNAEDGEGTKPLTPEQLKSIREAIPRVQEPLDRIIIAIFAYTSLRRGEAFALTWQRGVVFTESRDFPFGFLRIEKSAATPVDKAVIKSTKTKGSVRNFPMHKDLRDLLWANRRDSGFLISEDGGETPTGARLFYKHWWNVIASQIELYGATPMNFRTTFATLGVAAGIDPKTCQGLMGHSNNATTMDVYAKKQSYMYASGLDKIDSLIDRGEAVCE